RKNPPPHPSLSSSEQPVQEPPHVPGDAVLAVAMPKQPVPVPVLIFHPEVIAHRPRLATPFPPFPGDPLRPVRPPHPVPHPPPGEGHRWVIRQQRHRFHRLRRIQQPHRPRQIPGPCLHRRTLHTPRRSFRNSTVHRRHPVDVPATQPVRQPIDQRRHVGLFRV